MKDMDYPKIKSLIERYFLGETDLEEEKILRTYFKGRHLDERLLPYRPLFQMLEEDSRQQLADETEARLQPAFKRRRLFPGPAWAAAVLLLLLSLWWWYPPVSPEPTPVVAAIDWSKYEVQDEAEALRLTREALLKTGSLLNKGARRAAGQIEHVKEMGQVLRKD